MANAACASVIPIDNHYKREACKTLDWSPWIKEEIIKP